MEIIRQKLLTFDEDAEHLTESTVNKVRKGKGVEITSYRRLVECVAKIAFSNPGFVLLFRGQTKDYRENRKTTLFPSMFRRKFQGGYLLTARYEKLKQTEEALVYKLKRTEYRNRISRSQLLRWAIIQHYEVCPTPLLDLTNSLAVAASFAFTNSREAGDHVFLYVLGVPQISGSITVVSDQSIQLVRLASVCPPVTLRPYFQEGYLIGTYPLLDTIDEKMEYARDEVDCSKRLIAKFRLCRIDFWRDGFNPLHESALYPHENNSITDLIKSLRHNN